MRAFTRARLQHHSCTCDTLRVRNACFFSAGHIDAHAGHNEPGQGNRRVVSSTTTQLTRTNLCATYVGWNPGVIPQVKSCRKQHSFAGSVLPLNLCGLPAGFCASVWFLLQAGGHCSSMETLPLAGLWRWQGIHVVVQGVLHAQNGQMASLFPGSICLWRGLRRGLRHQHGACSSHLCRTPSRLVRMLCSWSVCWPGVAGHDALPRLPQLRQRALAQTRRRSRLHRGVFFFQPRVVPAPMLRRRLMVAQPPLHVVERVLHVMHRRVQT